ncbi:hypothetical protein [Bradyrhizobium sp.]
MTTRRVFLGGALAAASALTLPAWRVAGVTVLVTRNFPSISALR